MAGAVADYARAVDLEKWKRNDVFEAIKKVGLSPEEFTWDLSAEPKLIHARTNSYFAFSRVYFAGPLAYLAGDSPRQERTVGSWIGQMEHVERWLKDIKNYYEMPDLWAELRGSSGSVLVGAALEGAQENTPFTRDEQVEIAKHLREMSDYVRRTYSLSEDQLRALDERINYLETAAGRLGRVDWRNALLGAFLGAIVAGIFPPELVRAILSMILTRLAPLVLQVPPGLLGG